MSPKPVKSPRLTQSARGGFTYWTAFGLAGHGDGDRFNSHPHLTLGVSRRDVSAMVTLPNAEEDGIWAVAKEWANAEVISTVAANMALAIRDCPGMKPVLRLRQRHFLAYRAHLDAYLDVDLRVAKGAVVRPREHIKRQPEWIEAACRLLRAKGGENLEFQIGATFPYLGCEAIARPAGLDHVARAWEACVPFIEAIAV